MPDKTKFDFNLSTPITYHKEGESETAQVLTLYAPAKRNRKQTIKIKKGFYRAMNYHQAQNNDKEAVAASSDADKAADAELSGSEVLMAIYMSDVDMTSFDKAFEELLLSPGICKVDDSVGLTSPILDELSDGDVDRLLGDYMENFFLGSLMDQLK